MNEAFKILKEYKITSHIESVRRWLRNGVIKGIEPSSKKEGWKIEHDDLFDFINKRLPEELPREGKEANLVKSEEQIRTEVWWELVSKNIFEEFIILQKGHVQDCIEHKRYSKEFGDYVWKIASEHKRGYSTPRIPYILNAFLFEDERIEMDQSYEMVEDKIMFALIEYLRKKRVNKK